MGAGQSELDFLCVNGFLADLAGSRALASALELGIVDRLAAGDSCSEAALARAAGLDAPGAALLFGMLRAGGILESAPGGLRLTAAFAAALRFRELIEAKLAFAAAVTPDFVDRFGMLLAQPGRFYAESRLLAMFDYRRCLEATPENLAHAARWVRLTTALTRHEAPVCLARHDFSGYRRMLDVGGNSGEFALQACRRNPGLHATVLDLPVVCELGRRHVGGQPGGERVAFVAGGEGAPFPPGQDLVVFKSMLHDWPDAGVQDFLRRAHAALAPGGTLLVFERSRFDPAARAIPYGELPLALFYRSYREPGGYDAALAAAGFRELRRESIDLGLPFLLLSARK